MFPFRFIRASESAACPSSAPFLLPVTFSSFRDITGHSRLSQSLSTVPACQVSGLAAEELSYSSLKSNGILIFPQSQQALPRNQYLTCSEADRDEMEGLGMIRLSPTNQECFKDSKQHHQRRQSTTEEGASKVDAENNKGAGGGRRNTGLNNEALLNQRNPCQG